MKTETRLKNNKDNEREIKRQNVSAYSQKSKVSSQTISKLSFVWMLKREAPVLNNTLYKEYIDMNGDEATIARYYITATVLPSENPDDNHTETFKIYTAIVKGKKLKLVNNGPDKNEYFTLVKDKEKNIVRMVISALAIFMNLLYIVVHQ